MIPFVSLHNSSSRFLLGGLALALGLSAADPVAARDGITKGSFLHPARQQAAAVDDIAVDDGERFALIADASALWLPDEPAHRIQFFNALSRASVADLRAIVKADSMGQVQEIFGADPAPAQFQAAVINPTALGDANEDWVYTAVAPCRVVDTRNTVAGALGIGEERDFFVYGPAGQIVPQGGDGACYETLSEPRAVHINITAVPGTFGGNLRAYPADASVPNASVVNYRPGVNIANAAIVRTYFQLGVEEITIFASSGGHVVIDVMGYFYDTPEQEVYDLDSVEAAVNNPSGTTGWLAAPATIEIDATDQHVHVVASGAYGSAAGAGDLDIFVCYRETVSGSITTQGSGIPDLKVPGNTRIPMSISGTITGLAVGVYEVGMCGSSATAAASWDDNGRGTTTAVVFNPLL